MIIVSLELTLDFAESTQLRTPARAIFEALGGKVKEERRPHEPAANIRNSREKTAVRWDYKSCNMVQEDVDDIPKCISNFTKTIETVNKVAPVGKISCKRLRVYWILPVSKYDFKSLEMKYRQMFIKDSEIFSNCTDSTVVIDMKCDKWKLSHQSGAMNVTQLQNQFRVFNIKEGQAEIFLFLATTMTDEQLGEYSIRNMENFLSKSYEICKTHSDNFEGIMEGIL